MAFPNNGNIPDQGYVYYPSKRPGGPGHPRFDVIVRSAPTYQHFDPESVRFPIVSAMRSVETLVVGCPWRGGSHYRACAGRIVLRDRIGKTVQAFSFGGTLEIMGKPDCTLCALTSPAPIFDMASSSSLGTLFVSEVEIELAQRRAELARERALATFDRNLAEVKPLALYSSILLAVRERIEPLSRGNGMQYRHLYQFIQDELATLGSEGETLQNAPSLERIL